MPREPGLYSFRTAVNIRSELPAWRTSCLDRRQPVLPGAEPTATRIRATGSSDLSESIFHRAPERRSGSSPG